ncbi:unnamed protein product, partial [Closterium sp. Naga37s-1]
LGVRVIGASFADLQFAADRQKIVPVLKVSAGEGHCAWANTAHRAAQLTCLLLPAAALPPPPKSPPLLP